MEIKVRKAKLSDLETILKMSRNLFKFERKFGKTFNMKWTYSEVGKKYFTGRLMHKDAIVLIAVDGEIPAGYLCSFKQKYYYRSLNPIAEIENMYIDDKYRYKGVGKLLFKKLKQLLKREGVKRIKVGTLSQNEQAIRFYKRIGFEEFETILEQDL